MIPQWPVHSSSEDVPPSANIEREVTKVARAPTVDISDTTSTAVGVIRFNVTFNNHEYPHLKVNQINELETPLLDITAVQVLFLA